MALTLLIVDDFLRDPHALRNMALKLDYTRPEVPTGYPGHNALNRVNIEGLDTTISNLVRERVKEHPQSSHCRPRITLENEKGSANVHIDPAHWSGVLYLSKPEHCKGGTRFYKHIATQTTRAALEQPDIEAVGAKTREEANLIFKNIIANDTNDMSKWDCTMEVPMMFNRLILFDPSLYHTATPGFGDSLENGRLIFPLFFLSANA